ncbi:MAG TPA: hypothetical protein P5048_04205, partial [Chlamydiales bacterium]|nr:hypothetical protein [Chlamydiales bacterium]
MTSPNNSQTVHHGRLPDLHQSWWQLAAIQPSGVTSLPILTSSVLIIQKTNFISAFITLVLANILIWVIRYGIVAFSQKGRKSALDITYDSFGTIGAYVIAVILLLSTLAWFVMQTTMAAKGLSYLLPIEQGTGVNLFMQYGVLIGIISTLLCMNGIKVIKWTSIIALPLLLLSFVLMFIFSSPALPKEAISGISLAGLPIILGTNLGISVDIPTFFRHSESFKDSKKALVLIQIVSFVVGVAGLFLGSILEPWIGINGHNGFVLDHMILRGALIFFVFVSAITANITNVYSSSVGWEIVAPVLAGVKEYLILGLGLSISFILVAEVFSTELLADTTDFCLVNLSIIF